MRYCGARPLVEDGSVSSDPTTLVNVQAGYRLSNRARLVVDVFNLLDAEDSDIDYFYTSRLPGEGAEGVPDIHFHPTPTRTLRVNLDLRF